MARIGKEAQARILQQIDVEHRKVAEVAAEHGCTPANVYALLSKLRKKAAHPAVPETVAAAPAALEPAVKPADLFAAAPVTPPPPAEAPTAKAPAAKAPAPATASITVLPSRTLPKGLGAALAKPGFGLVMRTSEGEDSQTPFRSLDDLLSAIKPILRAAARSPDPVWFSIQPIDLAALDSDAA